MANYHVALDRKENKIYAGTVSKDNTKWTNKSEVTEECMTAVRDHFTMIAIKEQNNEVGYIWNMDDGSKFKLMLTIEVPETEEEAKVEE